MESPPDNQVDTKLYSATINEIDKRIAEKALWRNIHIAARSNPALQEALERVKIIYYLSLNNAKDAND